MRIVMKFGGTSVGDGARIKSAAALVVDSAHKNNSVAVVVSAMSGVTNALIHAARTAADGDAETWKQIQRTLTEQHLVAIESALTDANARAELWNQIVRSLNAFGDFCRSIHILGELTPRALDAVASWGERLTAPIFAQAIIEQGFASQAIEATELIVTDDNFTQASPLMDATREKSRARLLPLLDAGIIPVITGFIGATKNGITTTLGRGGSDYSGTILGSALDADEVWIWTDVDGVMTADPRIVPDAQPIAEISYAEAAELSYFGAKVIHPQTLSPIVEQAMPVRILNTFNPTHPGTRIVREAQANGRTVKAITAIRNLSLVTVEGRGMQGVPGVAAKVFSAVAREGANVLMISQSSSEQSICFVVEVGTTEKLCAALKKEFELEILRRNIDRVSAQTNVVIVAVVGAGMRGIPGIAARVFGALGEQHINIISIAQGSSEYNLSFVVDAQDADTAVRKVHAGFGLNSHRS